MAQVIQAVTKALAAVIGIHKHKCDNCGYIWEHGADSFGDDLSHTCPRCITHGMIIGSYTHYTGKKKALGYWGV